VEYCGFDATCKTLLFNAMQKLQLSARAYDRILKVARTIADLGRSTDIELHHLTEAIQYRSLDKEKWGEPREYYLKRTTSQLN